MKRKMQTDSSSTNNNASIEPTNEDSTAEKEKLLREIKDLKCIIEQCERELDTVRFENVEEHVSELQRETPSHPREISNVEVDLQNDLYNFAGLHCVKFRKDEVVFNFTSTSERQKKDIYAIQFFIKDGKAHLGKWIMPMSIDMDDMLTKIPLDKLENLTPFIKSCKHDIDCYIVRQEQFLSLKKQISHMKHCTLQSDVGYMNIVLELYGVHDRESDRYMNLIIYLLYHSNKARPHKINIDTMEKDKLNNDLKQQLKVCLNEFKISDLSTAFDKILTEDSVFTWMRTSDSDSPLELNDTSSCESLLVDLQLIRKKSLRKSKRRHQLQKKWNERKKQRIILTNNKSSDNEEDNQTKEARTESSLQISIKEKKTEPVPSTSKQRTKIYKNLTEETPLHKPKTRFKQTKLNFQNNQTANSASSINENLSFASKPHDKLENPKKKLKIIPLGTSTPLHRSHRRISSSSSLEIDNITKIKATTRSADKFNNDFENSRLTNKKIKRRKTPKLVSTTKSIGSLSQLQAVETNQRYTKSTKSKNVKK
ncbi:uncharacterized protein LOC105248302 [Camponotus floridanus]|uniref:uncharacterized protein LOC105248302 n=1 Tax=Camponotus floridanus TaxID=104421 RepID=UPI00059CC694|nr:uncharacterized protein LOC105248302 [Camponotus floridanus]